MEINVTGTRGKLANQLKEAAEFYADLLMDPRMVRNLTLDIEVESELDGVYGECVSEDDCKNPRYFTIRLQRKSEEDIFKTLAHEMVHVKQYAKNELGKEFAMSKGGKGLRIATRWNGEFWNPKRKEHAYFDSPWEQQAYGMEVGLFYKWSTRNDPKMKWCVGEGA